MSILRAILFSSVGKKVVMAITGLALIGFLVGHLLGNLTLLTGNADAFNKYGDFLMSLGSLIIVVEIGLIFLLLLHVYEGVTVWLGKQKARPDGYKMTGNAGGPSRKTLSSKTMIWTGIVVFIFVILHVNGMKYGPGIEEGYVSTIDGKEVRDLYRLVAEMFHKGPVVIFYAVCMVFLGFHLRHAFWSAFQSLGANHSKYSPIINCFGILLAIGLSVGFLVIPVWMFFNGSGL